MNRRQPLILVVEPQLVSSGLMPDRHAFHAPLWEAAENARFYQGKVRRLFPAATMFSRPDFVHSRGISQLQDSTGTRWLFHAGLTAAGDINVYRWYGPAPELVDTFADVNVDQTSQAPATFIDFLHWGNWTLMNSGTGAIRRFRPGTGLDDLPNAPTDVVAMLKKQNQLMLVGHGLNKKQVTWSHADDITQYDPDELDQSGARFSLAGTLPIEELETGIRAGARLGPHIACYAEDQLAIVSWIGAPFYYGQRVALDGIGAVGKLAVASDGRSNYGVSRNGIWRTDGSDYQYIDDGVLSDYLQANVNWDQGSKIVAARNDVNRTFEFHFPMGEADECTEGWAFDPMTGGWAPVPAVSSMQERRLFNKPVAGVGTRAVLLDDAPLTEAALLLRTKPMLVQSGGEALHANSKIDEIELMVKEATFVYFRYSVAEDINGPWASTEWKLISTADGMKTYQVEPEVPSGTYHRLEFLSDQPNWSFDLQGFALFGDLDGRKRPTL